MGQCANKLQRQSEEDVHSDSSTDSSDIDCSVTSVTDHPLINIRFDRTLFCGDIVYQYEVSFSVPGIASWTTQLTEEDLSTFYTETFQKWRGCHDAKIPNQYGKVMRSETFTECLQRVLDEPDLLKSKDTVFSTKIADLLSIPDIINRNCLFN